MRVLISLVLIAVLQVSIGQVFAPPKEVTSIVNYPGAIDFLDIDENGYIDIVFTASHHDKLAWFPNYGEGNFGGQKVISNSDSSATGVITFDADNDGLKDLLWTSGYSDHVGIHKNLGDGNFGPSQAISGIFNRPLDPEFYDFDADGDEDIFIASYDTDNVHLIENLGQMDFAEPIEVLAGPGGVISIELLDVDLDGLKDIVTANGDAGSISWFRNEGDGEYSTRIGISNFLDGISMVDSGDVDGDGDFDLVTASRDIHTISLFINEGDGGFAPELVLTDDVSQVRKVEFADMDNDGDLDISYGGYITDIGWIENLGTGYFNHQMTYTDGQTIALRPMDMDNDGILDIVASSNSMLRIVLFLASAPGEFDSFIPISSRVAQVRHVRTGDLNGDGHLDVIAASWDDQTEIPLSWFENNGDGTFGKQHIIAAGDRATSFHLLDVDWDGDLDVVSRLYTSSVLEWFENDGEGNFIDIHTTNPFTGLYLQFDFDQDGDLDIISKNSSSWGWHENGGENDFGTWTMLFSTLNPRVCIPLDCEGDGDIDFITLSGELQLNIVLRIQSDGGFINQVIASSVPESTKVRLMDVDADGDQDLLRSLYAGTSTQFWWYENSDGQMLEQVYLSENPMSHFQVIDIDGDGDDDIVGATNSDYAVHWIENQFPESMLLHNDIVAYHGSGFGKGMFVSDMNQDNAPDILLGTVFNYIVWLENIAEFGCTDPSACNYDPMAAIENSSCCFSECGCTVIGAENYNPAATCYNGECGFLVSGTVFFDENENGQMDESEYGLPYQELVQLPDSQSLITNDNGNFTVNVSGSENYTFIAEENSNFPFFTTPQSRSFDASQDNWNQHIYFGLSNEQSDFGIDVSLYPEEGGYDCDIPTLHNLCFRNMGNRIISGIVEFSYDELFQGYTEVTPIDSIQGQTIFMSFDSLYPGEMGIFNIVLRTPTVEYIGIALSSFVQVSGFHQGELVADGQQARILELTCAYDPNDKQSFPFGYTEGHYIKNDTIIEYLIRFQNTGNAPATDVIIRDTIDSNLDMTSFQLVANSHSVMTSVDPDSREVVFDFSGIMLPDSVNNEPESHGLVSIKIRPKQGLESNTIIHNKAGIYFDNNPPIFTNETWSTIFGCELMTMEGALEIENACAVVELDLEIETQLVEDINWTISQELLSDSSFILLDYTEIGEHELILNLSNPFCERDSVITFSVWPHPLPVLITFVDGVLSVPFEVGNGYQWYLGQNPFINGTANEWEPLVDGNYSVEVWNEFGCTASSEVFVIALAINDLSNSQVILFPNPMTEMAVLDLGEISGSISIEIFNLEGKLLRSEQQVTDHHQVSIERKGLASGNYLLRITVEDDQHELRFSVH